jgi:phosphoglucosamine mutase
MEKRIFGATDGIRSKVGEKPLRPAYIKCLGIAIAKFFRHDRILVARDTRASGVWIEDVLVEGVKQYGGTIGDLGVIPTPVEQKIIGARDGIKGGVMITASHNPATDNGLKVFMIDGDKLTDEQELEVERLYFDIGVGEDTEVPDVAYEPDENTGAIREYADMIANALGIDEEFDGGRIVLDAASGAGHVFSRRVFEGFGMGVEQIDPEPDGENINAGYGALYPEKMAARAKELGIMGVALDGDADRIVVADEEGRIWNGDRLVILLADYLKEKGELANDTVVLTQYSNYAAEQYLVNLGVTVDKVDNGDRYVAQKCEEIGAILGGEVSGHIIYTPWLKSSDGTFMTMFIQKILSDKGCRLADLWARYEDMPSKQWAVDVREKKPLDEIPEWNGAVAAATGDFDGDGRVFARYSGTENKLRILVEGSNAELVNEVGERLKALIEKEIGA